MPTRSRTTRHALGLAAACLAATAAPAAAQTGGTSPDAPAAPRALTPPPPTNTYGRPAPRIEPVACERGCGAAAGARPGALVRIVGQGLRQIEEVVFLGDDADDADDASVAPRQARRRASSRACRARPLSGPRRRSRGATARGRRDPARPLTIEPLPGTVPAGVIDAEAQEHKVFFDAQRPAELSYVVGGAQPADVVVELVRGSDGAVVSQWTPGGRARRRAPDRALGRARRRQGAARRRLPVPRHRGRRRGHARDLGAGRARRGATRRAPSRSAGSASRSPARTATAPAPRPSAAGAGIRDRTCSPRAGRRSWPRAAASSSSTTCSPPPATTSSSTARGRAWTTPTCTCATRRCPPRASASGPGS